MKKNIFLTLLILFFAVGMFSQTIDRPNYGLKSHETLEIESVVITDKSTTFFMVIENRSLDGSFCADKNIFIHLPDGNRIKVKEVSGIPRCPDAYTFKSFGEKLYFSLSFPSIPENTEWLDLVEDCDKACFSFNNVILNADLNQKIDHAYALVELGNYLEASKEFEAMLLDSQASNSCYKGAIYWNLVTLSRKLGNDPKANEWLDTLINSEIPLKEKYINNLKRD